MSTNNAKPPRLTDPRKHLVPAHYSWLLENFTRVFVMFVSKHPDVRIPPGIANSDATVPIMTDDGMQHVAVNTVTLNLSMEAVGKFAQTDTGFKVQMRFSGNPFEVEIPFDSIVAIYSPDSGNGSALQFPLYYGQESLALNFEQLQEALNKEQHGTEGDAPKSERPKLQLVKH